MSGKQPGARDERSAGETPGAAAEADGLRAQLAEANRALEAARLKHRADREREVHLRGELQHRVRNMLATVRSIFSRTVNAGGSIDDLASHFIGRMDVLARYQSVLTLDPGGSVDLETMVRDELLNIHCGGDPRITLEGSRVLLRHAAAQLLGLAIHELATNSIKFGAVSGSDDRARLLVRWSTSDSALHFCWQESGVTILAPAPMRSGFGREYIEQALPYQLGAEAVLELRPGGLSCRIAVPLAGNLVRDYGTEEDPDADESI